MKINHAIFIPDIVFNNYQNITPIKEDITSVSIFSFVSFKRNTRTKISLREYYEEWYSLILSNSTNKTKIYFFYTTESDRLETIRFIKYINNKYLRGFTIEKTNNLKLLLDVISCSKILVTGRMHAMIMGINNHCKIIPFIVSNKIQTFKNQYLSNFNDYSKLKNEIDQVFNIIKDLINE
jgi:polysaccharide pyruvyl transferase WcaK-like protein